MNSVKSQPDITIFFSLITQNTLVMYSLRKFFSTSFCIVLIFLSIQVQAQAIQLASLFNLYKLDRDQIDDFATKKGYVLWPTRDLGYSNKLVPYRPASYRPETSSVHRSLTLQYYKDNTLVETGYATSDREEYISLKSQIKARGYDFVSSKISKDNDFTVYNYENVNASKYVIVIIQSRNPGTGNSHYDIIVRDKILYDESLVEN